MAEVFPRKGRDLRLDFFRGLSLFFIFIDHIPNNFLNWFTLHSVAYCDAAEVFIFISGFTAALVYGRSMLRQGAVFATAQVYRRVWQLYVAHVFLFVIFTAEVSYTVWTFKNPMYSDETRVGDFLAEPHIAIIKALLLQFQPTFLDILPLYIVLLASFPLVLLLLRVHPLAALAPSLALYTAAHRFGWALPAYPAGHVWFFNPLNWQLLFVLGASFGFARVSGHRLLPPARWMGSLAIALTAAALAVKLTWTIHSVWDGFPALFLKALWPISKTNLAPLRIVNFLVIAAAVVALVPAQSPLLRSRAAQPIIRCGQQSLQIFCLGIVLSVLGHFILNEWSSTLLAQLLVNVCGFLLMIGMAWLLGWYRDMDRRGAAPAAAGRPSAASAAHGPAPTLGAD